MGFGGAFGPVFRPAFDRGLAKAFSPLDVAGLKVWLDASKITGLSNGAAVATWSDVSGNGNHATMNTDAYRPTYRSSAINSLPAVRFDGSNDFLAFLTPSGMLANNAKTIFAVFQGTGTGIYDFAISTRVDYGGVNNDERGYFVRANTALGYLHTATGNAEVADALTRGTAYITAFTVGTNAQSPVVYRNGSALTLTTANLLPAISELANGYTVIGQQAGGYSGGDTAEVIVYSGVLSTADRQAVQSYLSTKYNIT